MTHTDSMNRESQDWVRTIEEDKGYSAIDAASFRPLLRRMPGYAIFSALLKYIRPGQTALEAGCGWGLCSFALAERGVNVTAVDISAKLIADLDRLKTELGGPYATHLKVLAEDIFRFSSMKKTFDAVFSDGTYEHFMKDEDRKLFLTNIRAILKENGIFLVAVPNLNNPFFNSVVDQKMPAMHVFTVHTLARELEEGGFRVVEKGYSFVNPGFEQWVRSKWMIGIVRLANVCFRLMPRPVKALFAAHLYCVAIRMA